jgi:hypothetical protein
VSEASMMARMLHELIDGIDTRAVAPLIQVGIGVERNEDWDNDI